MRDEIEVYVGGEHINIGVAGQPDCCPIALALKDLGFCTVFVSDNEADGIEIDGVFYEHSCSSIEFVKQFDELAEATPSTFVLKRRKLNDSR